jgi:hypothetical protein
MDLTYRFCKNDGGLGHPKICNHDLDWVFKTSLLFPSIALLFLFKIFFKNFIIMILLFLVLHDSYFYFAISMFWTVLEIIILIAVLLLFLLLKIHGFHFLCIISYGLVFNFWLINHTI